MKRHVPLDRLANFASLAAATKTERVLVAVRNETVAEQYRSGIRAAGGDLGNLFFHFIGDEIADALPQTIDAYDVETTT
jgi:hypothetical protein